MKTRTLASLALTLAALLALPSAQAAFIPNGAHLNGLSPQGTSTNGGGENGLKINGRNLNGGGENGKSFNGWGTNGKNLNGGGENGKSAMGTRSSQTPTAIKVQSIQLPSGEVVTLR
ncbi:MAG: hypothetical protein IPO19_03110 [Rhodoferax sp.]|nr:hypothetical protein [Rhodoferax sp.]